MKTGPAVWRRLERDLKLAESVAKDLQQRAAHFLALSPAARRRAVEREWRKRFPKQPKALSTNSRQRYRKVIDALVEILEMPKGEET